MAPENIHARRWGHKRAAWLDAATPVCCCAFARSVGMRSRRCAEFRIGLRWMRRRADAGGEAHARARRRSIRSSMHSSRSTGTSRPLIAAGQLGGMPYAAKDMFRTLRPPAERRARRSESISALSGPAISSNASMQPAPISDRLHQHDRTGLRAVRLQRDARARQESVEPGLHLRRLVVGLGGRRRERRRCRCAGFRHRRLGAHSRACLRHHGLEADLWCGVGAGHDAACAHARHHRAPGPQRRRHAAAGTDHGRAAVVAAHRAAPRCSTMLLAQCRSGHPARARGRRGGARRGRRSRSSSARRLPRSRRSIAMR